MKENPIEVVVGLLLQHGAVLMGERNEEKVYPRHWEFPGGKLEPNETRFEALQRELCEELGIEIADAELWDAEIAHYSNGMTYAISYFLVRHWNGEIVNIDFNRVQWISNEMLPTLLHLSGNKKVLERLMQEGIPA